MTRRDDIRAELGTDAPEELVRLSERLDAERPVPSAAFRGRLRRDLLLAGAPRARPARLRLLIAAYASSGLALLVIGAASAAGVGPLAA
jgi:hypothetical protein